MTIFDDKFWWQFSGFWKFFWFLEKNSDFLKILWPDTWCLTLETLITLLTIENNNTNNYLLNKEWQGQHSQFLRCFISKLYFSAVFLNCIYHMCYSNILFVFHISELYFLTVQGNLTIRCNPNAPPPFLTKFHPVLPFIWRTAVLQWCTEHINSI